MLSIKYAITKVEVEITDGAPLGHYLAWVDIESQDTASNKTRVGYGGGEVNTGMLWCHFVSRSLMFNVLKTSSDVVEHNRTKTDLFCSGLHTARL